MTAKAKPETEIIKDAIRRFYHLPTLTIAKHVLATNGDMFDGNLSKIRDRIRYYLGTNGTRNREIITDKSAFRKDFDWKASLPQTWRKTRTEYALTSGQWLVIADVHVPFHEPKAVEAAVAYAESLGVKNVYLNGDIADYSGISFWPTAKRNMNKETEAIIDFLDWLSLEFERIVWLPGNHEYRMPRIFMSKLPELVETPYAAMEVALGLEKRNIEFLDYMQMVKAGILPVIHGHEVPMINRAVNPARGLFMRTKTFAMCSHCHTTSQHTTRDLLGNVITTWSTGCLCDLSPDYNPFGNDWNWGFAIISIEEDGQFEVQNYRILPNGKVVK